MLTRRFPPAAKPVARALVRDGVDLGVPSDWVSFKRNGRSLRKRTGGRLYCPMGLLPSTSFAMPINVCDFERGFNGFNDEEIKSFLTWFDRQTDAAAALRAIRRAGRA